MYKYSKFVVLIVTLVLLQCLSEAECKRGGSSLGRRGSSRGKNYGTSSTHAQSSGSSGGWFSSLFGGSSSKAVAAPKPASSGSGSSSSTGTKTNYGWSNPSQNVKPAQTNPSYGWSVPNANKPAVGTNNNPSYGWAVPNSNKQGNTGFGTQPKVTNNQFQNKPNSAPSANIGPRGYPVQPGMQTNHGYNTGGYNTGYRSNTGYHQPPPYSHNPLPGHSSFGGGGYHYQPNSFSSHHGFAPSYYPSQNHFGYPGQGLFGGNNLKYKGMGVFGGSSGHYGYPGSGSWGYPSYGTGMYKSGGGKTNLLLGAGLGLAGGYLASSLIHRVTNPWGYSGYGYGHGYGYDRGYYRRYDPYATTPVPPTYPPNPADNWIQCIAFDPTTNKTMINPNCTCSVTTSLDPATNTPVSVHNCTTANGIVLPPMGPNVPVVPLPDSYGMPQQPFNGINTPGAVPVYGGLYNDNVRYGAPLESVPPVYSENNSTTVPLLNQTSTIPENGTMAADSPESAKQTSTNYETQRRVKEFYTQLEKIVQMGKFT